MSAKPSGLKPIVLYDHLPGILAGYPAVLFAILALLSAVPYRNVDENLISKVEQAKTEYVQAAEEGDATAKMLGPESEFNLINSWAPRINSHMLFWVGLSIMLVWYIAFRFNMPKSKFILMAALLGCFVGIPVILEVTGYFRVFSWFGGVLGSLKPQVNTGAWVVMSLVFFVIWLGNLIYSLTHLKVRIDESGLTINRLGGKGERFELIGFENRKRTARLS